MAILKCFNRSCALYPYRLIRRCQSHSAVLSEIKPNLYPPVKDVSSIDAIFRNERQDIYDYIKQLPTVEEKWLEITTRYSSCGIKNYLLVAAPTRLGGLPIRQYITRTHLMHGLPEALQEMNVDDIYEGFKTQLNEAISSEYYDLWSDRKLLEGEGFERIEASQKVSSALISFFSNRLAFENEYLVDAAYDHTPRIEAFWYHGDYVAKPLIQRPQPTRQDECRKHLLKVQLHHQNKGFQLVDYPLYTIRTNEPLRPVVPHDDPLCRTAEVEQFNYSPGLCGMGSVRRNIVSVPGFWPGENLCEFPFISFHTTRYVDKLKSKVKVDLCDPNKIDDAFGIMSSFGMLMSHAANLGFTPFHDITYPLVAQTVLTNGQDWNFFVYQLNTICFHGDVDLKDKRNLCWSSGKMRLFETIEDGKLRGLNDDVLKVLLKFFLNAPSAPAGVNLKPYLGSRAHLKEDKMDVRRSLKLLFRNAPNKINLRNEIPEWQRIYKRHPDVLPSPWIKLK